MRCQLRVPANDEHSWFFRIEWNPNRPLTQEEIASYRPVALLHGEVVPGTFIPKANRSNDFMLDRALQRAYNYTGIKGQTEQESAVDLSKGKQPRAAQTRDIYGVHSCGILLKQEMPLEEGVKARLQASN